MCSWNSDSTANLGQYISNAKPHPTVVKSVGKYFKTENNLTSLERSVHGDLRQLKLAGLKSHRMNPHLSVLWGKDYINKDLVKHTEACKENLLAPEYLLTLLTFTLLIL